MPKTPIPIFLILLHLSLGSFQGSTHQQSNIPLSDWHQAIVHPSQAIRNHAWEHQLPQLWAVYPKQRQHLIQSWYNAITHTFWYVKESAWQHGFATWVSLRKKSKASINLISMWQNPLNHESVYVTQYIWTFGLPILIKALSSEEKSDHIHLIFGQWQTAIQHSSFIIRHAAWANLHLLCHTCTPSLKQHAQQLFTLWQQATQDDAYPVCQAAWEHALAPLYAILPPTDKAIHQHNIIQIWVTATQSTNENVTQAAWQHGFGKLCHLAFPIAYTETIQPQWQKSVQRPQIAKILWWHVLPLLHQHFQHTLQHQAICHQLYTTWYQSIHHKTNTYRNDQAQAAWEALPTLYNIHPHYMAQQFDQIYTAWLQAAQHPQKGVQKAAWQVAFPTLHHHFSDKILCVEGVIQAWHQSDQYIDINAYTTAYYQPQYCIKRILRQNWPYLLILVFIIMYYTGSYNKANWEPHINVVKSIR